MEKLSRAALYATTALSFAALLAPVAAQAADSKPAVGAAAAQPKSFDIPAGDLPHALELYAAQSGAQLIYRPEDVSGGVTRGVRGNLSSDAALQQLLQGTRLEVRRDGSGASAIVRAQPVAPKPAASPRADRASAGTAMAADPATDAQGSSVGEVVVTAQRREERLKDVPLTVVAVNSTQLKAAGVTALRDLGAVVSGYTVGGLGFSAQPAIRGVSTFVADGEGGSPNALYIDGVYQPLFTFLIAELSDIDRVEVLKGPQGTLFGRNATGGAIQLFTKSVSFTPHGDFSASVGAFTGGGGSHSSANVDIGGFLTGPIVPDMLAGSISGGYRYTPGYLNNDVTGREDGVIKKGNVRAKLLFTPTQSIRFVLEGHYVNLNNFGDDPNEPYSATSSTARFFPGSISPTQPWHVAYNQQNIIGLTQYGFSLTGKINTDIGKFTSITAYEDARIHTVTTLNGSFGTPACFIAEACIDYAIHQRTTSVEQELNFLSKDFGPLSFTAGLFYLDINAPTISFLDELEAPPGIIGVNDTLHDQSYAVYGEAMFKVTDRLNLIAGLRYGVENENDNPAPGFPNIKLHANSLTPRVSIRYAVTDELNVYATYSQGYKTPLSGAVNAGSSPAFAPVRAEKITSYEVGAKFGNRIASVNISAFYYDYANKQEQTFNGFQPIVVNTGPVRIDGLDVDTNFRLSDDFMFRSGLSWLADAKYLNFPNANEAGALFFNASGLRLPRAPDVSGNSTLQYLHDFGGGSVDANVTVSYSSLVYHSLDHTVLQPAYATVSAQAGYTFKGAGVHLSVYGHNLTNAVVIQGSIISFDGATKTLAAPREVGVRAEYSF